MLALDAAFWVVCLVLVAAGATKLIDPRPFADALRGIGLPRRATGASTGRLVGGVEVVVGLCGLAVGGTWSALAVALAYAVFAVVVLVARRRGLASCGCFGSRSAPPSVVHAGVNLLSAAVALAAALSGPAGSPEPVAEAVEGRGALGALVVVVTVVVAAAVLVVDTRSWGATVPAVVGSRGTDERTGRAGSA